MCASSPVSNAVEFLARHLMIVEGENAFARDLRAFVALARDQNNVSRLRFSQRQRNGLAAVGLGGKARLRFRADPPGLPR